MDAFEDLVGPHTGQQKIWVSSVPPSRSKQPSPTSDQLTSQSTFKIAPDRVATSFATADILDPNWNPYADPITSSFKQPHLETPVTGSSTAATVYASSNSSSSSQSFHCSRARLVRKILRCRYGIWVRISILAQRQEPVRTDRFL